MSVPLLPPTPGVVFPPPPPCPSPPPWRPPPSPPTPPTHNNKSVGSGAIAGISIAIGMLLFLASCIRSLIRGQRQSGAANDAAALASPPRTVVPDHPRHAEQQTWRGAALPEDEPRRSGLAAALPSFTYNRSVKHNVTGGDGEEAATCSVCLSAFQTGETVRLLPVCLHLYHVECIDPWLDAHSSCPICRTGTDPAMDGGLLPPVY